MKPANPFPLAASLLVGLTLITCWPQSSLARVLQPEPSQGESSALDGMDRTWLALVRYNNRRRYQRPRWGAPRWSYGGAARGGCHPGDSPVVPLVPIDDADPANPSFLGMTSLAYPSLLVYVPPTQAQAVELLVLDEKQDQLEALGEVIYQKQISLTQSPSIIRFDLAMAQAAGEAVQALEEGRHYTWTVSLVCDPLDPSGNPFVNGLIQRVPGVLPSEEVTPADPSGAGVTPSDPYERINQYAEASLWHETLAAMSDLHCARPADAEVTSDWRSLLFSLNLAEVPELVEAVQPEDIAAAPLVGCTGGQ
ncbi:MAG TPA: DUF928 domain-containing protein [Leptolyngbyaceae cyanobacterium]